MNTPDTEWVEELLKNANKEEAVTLKDDGISYEEPTIYRFTKQELTNLITFRDTYWRERVRTVIDENQGDYESKNPDINWVKAVPVNALNILLDNLK